MPVLEREMTEEIRVVIPAEADFRPIAHLVTGGLAVRIDLTLDDLQDFQVALATVLGLRDDEDDLVVSLGVGDGLLRASVGPFDAQALRELEEDESELGPRRVLETVADAHEIDERDDGAWIELSKRIATAAGGG